MKKLVFLAILFVMTSPLWGQAIPNGAPVKIGDGVFYLNKSDNTWQSNALLYPDTVNVSTGLWTKPLKSLSGHVNLEGMAILTAGTDSFKIICYGSNSQSSTSVDTTMLTRLDSTKVLAAGLYTYDFIMSGKYKPWLVFQWVPLNPGASTGGKSRRTSVGVQ